MSLITYEFFYLIALARVGSGRAVDYRTADGSVVEESKYDLAEKFETEEAAEAVVATLAPPAEGLKWSVIEHGFQVEETACST